MKAKVIVLNAKRSQGEFNGKHYESTKIECLSEIANDVNLKGTVVSAMKGAYQLFDKVKEVPGIYEVDFTLQANGTRLDDLSFVKPYEISVV